MWRSYDPVCWRCARRGRACDENASGIDDFSASARINQYERGKHMPDLQTLGRLAAVLKVPVPYFYCEDSELAEVVVKFAALGKGQRKKAPGLLASCSIRKHTSVHKANSMLSLDLASYGFVMRIEDVRHFDQHKLEHRRQGRQ